MTNSIKVHSRPLTPFKAALNAAWFCGCHDAQCAVMQVEKSLLVPFINTLNFGVVVE